MAYWLTPDGWFFAGVLLMGTLCWLAWLVGRGVERFRGR